MWLLFDCPRQPIYDRNGTILPSQKRRVFFGEKRNFGGEWVTPDLRGYKVTERYQRENTLLVKVEEEHFTLPAKSYIFTPKIQRSIGEAGFKKREITEAEAEKRKREIIFGKFPDLSESGTTKIPKENENETPHR